SSSTVGRAPDLPPGSLPPSAACSDHTAAPIAARAATARIILGFVVLPLSRAERDVRFVLPTIPGAPAGETMTGVVGRIAAALGLGVAVFSAALVGATDAATTTNTTYGDVSATFALLEVLVAVGLVAAAALLISERSTATLGALAVAASLTWVAPVWVGWTGGNETVRSLGLVLAPLLPLAVLGIVVFVPPTAAGA